MKQKGGERERERERERGRASSAGLKKGRAELMNNCVDVPFSSLTAGVLMYSHSFIQEESHLLCCHRGQKCDQFRRSCCKYGQYAVAAKKFDPPCCEKDWAGIVCS